LLIRYEDPLREPNKSSLLYYFKTRNCGSVSDRCSDSCGLLPITYFFHFLAEFTHHQHTLNKTWFQKLSNLLSNLLEVHEIGASWWKTFFILWTLTPADLVCFGINYITKNFKLIHIFKPLWDYLLSLQWLI